MKTYLPEEKEIVRKWFIADAKGKILGRLATKVAIALRGKDKPTFTPHLDTGDGVIVINASKIAVSGKKLKEKTYTRYSGYPGGLKTKTLEDVLKKDPRKVVLHAVKGMLPKNTLGRNIIKRLKIYSNSEHPHTAQKPEELKL